MRLYNHCKYILLLCLQIVTGYISLGQQLSIKSGLFGFFDNREYFNYYANDQTIFGTRAYTQVGFTFNQKNEFFIGIDGLYEFGSNLDADNINPILYIHRKNVATDLYLGSFYRNPIVRMPDVLLNDTLQYYRPNMEGIYLSFTKTNFNHNIWIDWSSRQSMIDKEIFYLGGSGSIFLNNFFYKHDFVIVHYALTSKVNTNEHIRDNGGIYSRFGIDVSEFFFFDTLIFSTGIVFSYDRTRNITPLRYNKGYISEISLSYKTLGLKYTNYFGDGQKLITGDPLYKAKFYNRLDLIWKIFNRPGIEGEVELSFHFINDFIDYSQKFTLRAEIDYLRNLKSRVD